MALAAATESLWRLPLAHGKLASAQRAALVDLYLATNGPSWKPNTGWADYANASNDPCADGWFGVTCAGTMPDNVVYVGVSTIALP